MGVARGLGLDNFRREAAQLGAGDELAEILVALCDCGRGGEQPGRGGILPPVEAFSR